MSAADDVMGAVNTRAMEVVDLPRAEREARYVVFHEAHFTSAVALGRTDAQARELADKMDEWVREAVRIVEAKGGAAGGRA